jgi:hypothetical protein
MKAIIRRSFTVATAALMFLGISVAAHAVVIDFSGETPGSRANGFAPLGFPGVTFTDSVPGSLGTGLSVDDFGAASAGIGLGVSSDTDGSGLFIDFAFDINSISLDFGNDDPAFTDQGDLALLRVFHNGGIVAQTTVALNRDDILNQTITLSAPLIDRVFFAYVDPTLSLFTGTAGALTGLTEVVDNINFTVAPVPLPAALPLFLAALSALGFCGWRRRRTA